MIKNIFFIIGSILLLISCGKKATYRIEGKINNLENPLVYAVFESDNETIIDSITSEKPGQFLFEQQEGNYQSATLFFENKTTWITVYPEAGEKITITGDINYPSLLQVKGGQTNNELTSFRKSVSELLKEQDELRKQLQEIQVGRSSADQMEISTRLANVNIQLNNEALNYIQSHPDEKASVILMQTFFAHPDDTRKLDELLAVLAPELKNFYLVKELEQFSTRAKRTELGAEAPDFSVKNVYGHTISLDSFPEKYVLLTFTAPWCDMCQTENLYLDEIVQKYPKDQLDLLLISLDDDLPGVRQVLKEDSIQWNLVADSAGQAAMLLDLYNVSALPRSFLIDEEGKIILKTENGLEIKQTLERILEPEP